MHQNEQPSCSYQVDIPNSGGGEYCTLKEVQDTTTIRKKADKPATRQGAQPSNHKQENNNINLSPRQKVARSKSTPESLARGAEEEPSRQANGVTANGFQAGSSSIVIAPGRRSTGHVRAGGRRSLGSLSNREPPAPLCYFAYLGRLTPTSKGSQRGPRRNRLPSAHDILADRPVILTSTSIVSPYATNVICQEFEAFEERERRGDFMDLLDCCTCMCCVKGLFYHCTKDTKDEGSMEVNPCSCEGPMSGCLARWGVMGLMSVFMPCLLCYLPFEAYFKCNDCMRKMKHRNQHKDAHVPSIKYSPNDEPSSLSIDSRRDLPI